jgi:hypothetical protein
MHLRPPATHPVRPVRRLVLAAGLACSAFTFVMPIATFAQDSKQAAAAAQADPVPIKKIVLYRSGVGYFERNGLVNGDAEVQLRFNAEQINDILKSMVLLDLDGGRIDTVSYASKEPLAKRLASFGLNISNNPSVPEILGQLRGAPLKVVISGEQITGTVLGVEERTLPPREHQQPVKVPHLNLVTPTGLRSVAITDVSSFEILDKELAGELNKALATLAEYRADRTKTVDLRFAGQGSRNVVVGYVHEMPVWKTSYRLVLPDAQPSTKSGEGAATSQGEVMLQGWAIVENTTDQDWNDVTMSLVSGRPVSFQMDLYEPLYTFRPTLPVPTIPGVMPRSYAGGMDREDKAGESGAKFDGRRSTRLTAGSPPPAAAPAMEAMKSSRGEGAEAEYQYRGVDANALADYAAQAQAQAGEVGEVFQYTLNTPVSIERQRSAMIPILTSNVPGRRVSIFNLADGSEHPMRGIELTNDSNLQLLPGPISVFDGAAYSGDAQIGHVGEGDKRLLAYAVDLDVDVQTKQDDTNSIVKLRIVDGLIEQTVKNQTKLVYTFKNNDEKRSRTMFVEHWKGDGSWTLVNPAKADNETQTHYRFIADIEAGKKLELPVVGERTVRHSIGVLDMNMTSLLAFHRDGKISDKAMEAIRKATSMQSAINETERQINQLNQTTAEISAEQNRIRENMGKIDRTNELYKRYLTKLNDQETQLENINEQRIAAQSKLDEQRREFNDYLRGLNVE